ncbi:hypothetical protein L6452_41843 [Arctium lappa]|uniref:Uncharacterized protein n=1 Tax=Arctium lappa TaxID=4217 RepID=A0ACB8XGK2_ARCLA|nr:hypothetical protein L6452_41843 [Arctium lappa]
MGVGDRGRKEKVGDLERDERSQWPVYQLISIVGRNLKFQDNPIAVIVLNIRMGLCFSSTPKDEDEDEPDHHKQFMGGNVNLITDKDAWDKKLSEAKTQGKIVIANFSATWCDPCKSVAPFYVELSEKHPSLMFLTIDVDELTEFSKQWEVKATPTFFFLRDGQQIDKLVGANKQELEKKIANILEDSNTNH